MDTTLLVGLVGAGATIVVGVIGLLGVRWSARMSADATLQAAREAWAQNRADRAHDATIEAFSAWIGAAAEAVSAQETDIPYMTTEHRLKLKPVAKSDAERGLVARGMGHAARTGQIVARTGGAAMRERVHAPQKPDAVAKALLVSRLIAGIGEPKNWGSVDDWATAATKQVADARKGLQEVIHEIAPASEGMFTKLRVDPSTTVATTTEPEDESPRDSEEHSKNRRE
ncbi:MAG: hypothetical protein WCJ30_21750 [Deltaproteobacteria bacterium]